MEFEDECSLRNDSESNAIQMENQTEGFEEETLNEMMIEEPSRRIQVKKEEKTNMSSDSIEFEIPEKEQEKMEIEPKEKRDRFHQEESMESVLKEVFLESFQVESQKPEEHIEEKIESEENKGDSIEIENQKLSHHARPDSQEKRLETIETEPPRKPVEPIEAECIQKPTKITEEGEIQRETQEKEGELAKKQIEAIEVENPKGPSVNESEVEEETVKPLRVKRQRALDSSESPSKGESLAMNSNSSCSETRKNQKEPPILQIFDDFVPQRMAKTLEEEETNKKAKPEEEEEEEEEEGFYTVEKIMGIRKIKGVTYYKVKWEGYPHSENTWEPIENLQKCQNLIEEFVQNDKKSKKLPNQNEKKTKRLKKIKASTTKSSVDSKVSRKDRNESLKEETQSPGLKESIHLEENSRRNGERKTKALNKASHFANEIEEEREKPKDKEEPFFEDNLSSKKMEEEANPELFGEKGMGNEDQREKAPVFKETEKSLEIEQNGVRKEPFVSMDGLGNHQFVSNSKKKTKEGENGDGNEDKLGDSKGVLESLDKAKGKEYLDFEENEEEPGGSDDGKAMEIDNGNFNFELSQRQENVCVSSQKLSPGLIQNFQVENPEQNSFRIEIESQKEPEEVPNKVEKHTLYRVAGPVFAGQNKKNENKEENYQKPKRKYVRRTKIEEKSEQIEASVHNSFEVFERMGSLGRDSPLKITDHRCLVALNENAKENAVFRIEWKKRKNGMRLLSSFETRKRIKEFCPELLADYYESFIEFEPMDS